MLNVGELDDKRSKLWGQSLLGGGQLS